MGTPPSPPPLVLGPYPHLASCVGVERPSEQLALHAHHYSRLPRHELLSERFQVFLFFWMQIYVSVRI